MYRKRSLGVLKDMRRTGNTLQDTLLPPGLSEEIVVDSIKGALCRSGKTWAAREHDDISRGLHIIERGRIRSIIVDDSHEASKLGKYRYAVGRFSDTGDQSLLGPFKTMHVRDSRGKVHSFETDPKLILEALKRTENGTYEVYK
jgi:hypothetical protein